MLPARPAAIHKRMTQTANRTVSRVDQGFSRDELEKLRQSFAEHGYLVIRGVVSKERLSELRSRMIEEFERAKRSGGLFSGGGLITGHLNSFPGEQSRFAYDALEQAGIIDVVRALSPKSLRAPNVGCNLNLPKSVPQHYHVDSAFMRDFMVLNVAVVDTDLENGAIDVLPGTHRKFYKYWRFALEKPYRLSTRLPLSQGDVLLRTSNLWHRGMPNHTAVPRPMLAFTWEEGGSVHDDPFRVGEGKIAFHANWYRTNWLGRLRERTFVAAPFTYSAYRFVRSLFGNKGYDSA
jgi:ectoine hydroxylase-related dioxygenase (phytanoyl-CoA dioxygenase family)